MIYNVVLISVVQQSDSVYTRTYVCEKERERGVPGGASCKVPACQCRRRKRRGDIRDTALIPGWERSTGGGHATHSSILAWSIPWTEEPGGLQFMGSHRVRHHWSNLEHTHTGIYTFFLSLS